MHDVKVHMALAAAALLTMSPSHAQLRGAFPGAAVPVYTPQERAAAFQRLLRMGTPPVLGPSSTVTPNVPYAPDGTRISFWKPSFVLGTADGGEAGVNFFRLYNEGHINIGFTAKASGRIGLDCRLLSKGNITYKIFAGGGTGPQGEVPLEANHFLLVVPVTQGQNVSVELWPTPTMEIMGFLGCDVAAIGS